MNQAASSPEKKTTFRGAKIGLMISSIFWALFLGSIVLSYAGLLFVISLANMMSVNNASWFNLLLGSPGVWVEAFGSSVPTILQGWTGATLFCLNEPR